MQGHRTSCPILNLGARSFQHTRVQIYRINSANIGTYGDRITACTTTGIQQPQRIKRTYGSKTSKDDFNSNWDTSSIVI